MTDKIWNQRFVYACIINMVLHSCNVMSFTLTAKFADYLGATESVVGIVASVFAISSLGFKVLSAPAIDTFNRKHVLMGAECISFISFALFSLSFSIPMLVVSRSLQGIGVAFNCTCCLAIAADSLPPDKMSTGVGYLALTTAISQAIAPAISLRLAETVGYNYAFAVIALVTFLGIVFIGSMRMSFTRTKKLVISLGNMIAKECAIPVSILILLNITHFVVHSFLILFAESRGIGPNIGFFFTVYSISLIFTRPLFGKLADRHGPVVVMIPAMLCFAASFFYISICNTLGMFILAGFISAFGFGGCLPAIQAVALRSVPFDRRGAASCTCYIGSDLGVLLGPTIAGVLAESFGYVVMWRVMTIQIFAALVICARFRKQITNAGKDLAEDASCSS